MKRIPRRIPNIPVERTTARACTSTERGITRRPFKDLSPKIRLGLRAASTDMPTLGGDPVSFTDPGGNCPWCVCAAFGAGWNIYSQLQQNGGNWNQIDPWQVAISVAAGALVYNTTFLHHFFQVPVA